jgi:hypothetical protein
MKDVYDESQGRSDAWPTWDAANSEQAGRGDGKRRLENGREPKEEHSDAARVGGTSEYEAQ